MSEGRLADVVLLDDQHLEILVQNKLHVHELMGMVASHCNLRREKHYFGLSFRDETGHYQWLQLDKHILDHEYPKKSGTITLYFQVKFYIESILLLMERTTVILFYMQSKQLLCKGLIETDSETIFELSAYVLQISHGDYQDDTVSRNNLKNFQLPRKILEENPSISFCEDQIISFYKRLCGLTSGSAIINYMSIVESLPTYGIHYYGVKDKGGIPWWIGVGVRGISVFDHADKKLPRKFFPWKSLENLFFRDRKFTIEVGEPKSSSKKSTWNHKLNSSTEDQTVSIVAHVWITPSTNLARSIWTMAVNQHQFYLDRKHLKNHTSCPWNLEDLRFELDNNTNNTNNTNTNNDNNVNPSAPDDVMNSSISAPNLMISELRDQSSQRNTASKLFEGLKSRKKLLEEKLRTKLEEFKELCLKEAELTGSMPEDLLMFFSADEIPHTRRRVGTSFMLSSKLLNNDLSQADDLTQLEVSYEVQEKLMTAVWKLAQDKNTSKTIRKKMRQDFREKQIKLKELEERINELRLKRGKELLHARSLEDIDGSVKFESLKKHAFHSSHSQNEDPDKNSIYSSMSNKSSSSTTSIPDQQQQQQSPSSGIKFYPKKKLSDSSLSHHKLQHSNSNRSSRSDACSTPEDRPKPQTEKSDRRQGKSSGRVEGRRRSNHFVPKGTTGAGDNWQFIGSRPNAYDEQKSKYSSLDRRRKSSGMSKDKKQKEEEERRGRRRGSMELPQLTPSKYGSKRDSTLEDDDDDDDNDDDDDDTLGKHDESISSSTCHYLPNSCQWLQPHLRSSIRAENSDSGIGNSTCLLKSCEDDVDSSSRQRLHNEKYFLPAARCNPFIPEHPPSCADSTSSGSSSSLHFRPPLRPRFETMPSGPDKLTRVITDVRVVGPRPPVGPSFRNQRNEEAVDALFKHYEEKILPSRMTSVRDDDADKNQSHKIAKPKDYLTSPRTKNKNRGFASRAEFDVNRFLSTSNSTLPKIKTQTFRFCSTLV